MSLNIGLRGRVAIVSVSMFVSSRFLTIIAGGNLDIFQEVETEIDLNKL